MTWLSWLLLLCGLTLSTGVELRNVTEPFVVTFEVGQHYQHPLPTLFSMYQATFVSLMQHPNRELYQNPCWPKEVAPSAFKHDAAQAFHY